MFTCERIKTLRNVEMGSRNVGKASNDEAATCCLDKLNERTAPVDEQIMHCNIADCRR